MRRLVIASGVLTLAALVPVRTPTRTPVPRAYHDAKDWKDTHDWAQIPVQYKDDEDFYRAHPEKRPRPTMRATRLPYPTVTRSAR